MHLGIDLLFLVPSETGGRETYVRELLPALRRAEPELRVTTFVNRETAGAGPGFWSELADSTIVLRGASARARARWALGELVLVAAAAGRAGVELLHSPANFGPWHGRFARVLTLHDIGFRTHPELVPTAMRLGTEALVVPAARRAHRVITAAQDARADLVERIGVAADRIAVVPHGIAAPGAGDRPRGRERLRAGDRAVVLSVATDLPHKNLDALCAAVARMDPRPLLVLAGHGTEQRAADGVRGLGAVSAAELEDLYSAADAFATATRHEGFGLPVLEAFARGVPVACSDLPVLREVAGEAVVTFDPDEPDQIAAALQVLIAGGPEVSRRLAAGRERAAGFTWEAAAAGTLGVYREALSAHRNDRRARPASR